MNHRLTPRLTAALTLTAAFLMSAGCTRPKDARDGCIADIECREGRICSDGVCTLPGTVPDAGSETPDAGGDTGHPDQDADQPTPPDPACIGAPLARATIGAGPQPSNKTAITAKPGAKIYLDASSSEAADGGALRYRWSFVTFPYADHIPQLKPRLLAQPGGTAQFDALTLGTYILEVEVVDADDKPSCEPARVQVEVGTNARIFVELVWDTPGDDDPNDNLGADLDLHYRHPAGDWGYPDSDLDIFWYVPTADWGERGDSSDDPQLLRDDEDGWGPETITHPNADPLIYSVGVYYYDDHGFGPSYATVRVYLDGQLAAEVKDEQMMKSDTFYEVLSINAANNTITFDNKHYDGYPPPK